MKKKCFTPDSIPELQKKNISNNVGRPAKITARKPAEQILNEKDYQNTLAHLIIQNETLTQLKKEIEYKLNKLKDEETSLNLLHKKYNQNNTENDIEENKKSKKEEHLKLFNTAQKEWEERKQELINGNYIDLGDNDIQDYFDNNILNSEINIPPVSNPITTDDSVISNLSDYTNDLEKNNPNNFDTPNNLNADKDFSLSPDFSLSNFNFEDIDNLEALDPDLMNLDIDFDMNLLGMNIPKEDNINEDLPELAKPIINNIVSDHNNGDIMSNDDTNSLQEISNTSNNSVENNTDISLLPNITNSESDISKIINELNPTLLPISNNNISNTLNEKDTQNLFHNQEDKSSNEGK